MIIENGVAVIDGDTHHRHWIREAGRLDHDFWFAGQICQHLRIGDRAIEVGAHIGTLTRPMIDAGAFVDAFEPNQEAFECLLHNCKSDRLFAFPYAVGDRCSTVQLHRAQNAGASFVTLTETGDIPIVTLDSLPGRRVRLIKIDAEGWELRVLLGAERLIEEFHPVIIAEVNQSALERVGDSEAALYDFLQRHRYKTRIIQPQCSAGDPQYDLEAVHEG